MAATRLTLPAVVLLACALTGCGVDSTRSLWAHPWMGDPPEHRRAVWQAGKVAEYGAKGVITPLAVTLDVVTDRNVWIGVLVVGIIALEVVAAGSCDGGGGGGGGCSSSGFHFCGDSGDGAGHDHGHHHGGSCSL